MFSFCWLSVDVWFVSVLGSRKFLNLSIEIVRTIYQEHLGGSLENGKLGGSRSARW